MDNPMNPPPAATSTPPRLQSLQHWAPGLATLFNYRRAWFAHDLVAGLALTAILLPVGMGYAEASGVPAINGLYATIIPLVVYAIFGPSRIMVLGPDSTMAAVIAALVLPLSGGSATHAIALAGALALLSGAFSLLMGFARLGLLADLLSETDSHRLSQRHCGHRHRRAVAQAFGVFRRGRGVAGPSAASGAGHGQRPHQLGCTAVGRRRPGPDSGAEAHPAPLARHLAGRGACHGHIRPLGTSPPPPTLPYWAPCRKDCQDLQSPAVTLSEMLLLVPGAAIIALLSFADTGVLSRSCHSAVARP